MIGKVKESAAINAARYALAETQKRLFIEYKAIEEALGLLGFSADEVNRLIGEAMELNAETLRQVWEKQK